MRLIGALLITLSSLTPASSVFVIVPGIVQQAGTGAVLAFLAAGAVSLLVALVYAELASAFPLTGGEYAIIARVLGPAPGFVVLGVNLLVLLLNISVVALGVGAYLAPITGALSPGWTAVASIAFCTGCAMLNIKTNALITGAFLGLELLALVVLTVLGLAHMVRPAGDLLHPVFLAGNALLPTTLGAFGLAGSAAFFANYGFGNAIFLGEETVDAPRKIAHAVLWAVVIGIIAQLIPLAAVLLSAPDLKTLFASDTMFGDFVTARGGPALSLVISLSVALAIVNCNIAFVILVARLLFSTGRDRVWPARVNRALLLIHPRFGSPWVATLAAGGLAAAFCFIPLRVLLVLTGTTIVAVYVALCAAQLAGRGSDRTAHARWRMRGHPWVALLALGGLGYVVVVNWNDPAVGRPSVIATLALIVASALYYVFVLRRKGEWVLYEPDASPPGLAALDPLTREGREGARPSGG